MITHRRLDGPRQTAVVGLVWRGAEYIPCVSLMPNDGMGPAELAAMPRGSEVVDTSVVLKIC